MRLMILAAGEFAVPTLRSLAEAGQHPIVCVLTQPDRPAGRGRQPTPTPVKQWALSARCEVIEAEDVNEPSAAARLGAYGADLAVVIAFGQKLGAGLIDSFPLGCVNLHASLLPRFRGAAPVQWAILSGEERTGVTVFRLTSRMDGGPILTRRETVIKPDETADELHDRLARIGPDAVREALAMFKEGAAPAGEPQSDIGASRAPKLSKRDSLIGFDQSVRVLVRRVNGLWSWPGAACVFVSADRARRERVVLARARLPEVGGAALLPGAIDGRLYVSAADGFIEVLEMRPESGRLMSWAAFVNGRHVRAGDRFEPVSVEETTVLTRPRCP